MKTSSKLITFGSFILASLILLASGVGLFVIYSQNQQVDKKTEISHQKDNYQFFNDIKNKDGLQIKLNKQINSYDILYLLTDFLDHYDLNRIEFDTQRVKKNILNVITQSIASLTQFNKITDYYIKVNYEIKDGNLLLDVRWTLMNNIINGQKTQKYWDQLKISIN